MFRLVPPAGTPIGWYQIAEILLNISKNGCHDLLSELNNHIQQLFNVKYCFPLSSGRAALTIVLRSLYEMQKDHQKKEVIIPAYTCFSVAAAVVRAGLKIRLCDINPTMLDFNLDKLEQENFSHVLAIIPSSLFGIPSNLPHIVRLAEQRQVFVIDDACQSLGAKIEDRLIGNWGIAGILSFDRGKNITAIGGGVIITNHDRLAQFIMSNMKFSNHDRFSTKIDIITKLAVYSLLLKPGLYWIPFHLPFLKLGQTIFDSDFPIESFFQIRAAIALEMLKYVLKINNQRRKNAQFVLHRLIESNNIRSIKMHPASIPVYSRLPFLISSQKTRDQLISLFIKNGIVATGFYPYAIYRIREIKNHLINASDFFTNSETVAQKILTLPTHPYVTQKDLDIMTYLLNEVSQS